jgi:hypothetical protein
MKKKIGTAARDESLKRGRKAARKCPCCDCAPCACDKACFCQELKAQMPDDDIEDAGFEDVLRFSFLRPG